MEIIGKIIGNKEGRIVVATLDLKIYELDRFAVIKRLFDDVCLFNVPDKEEKKRLIVKTLLEKDDQVLEIDLNGNTLKKTWGLKNEKPIKLEYIFYDIEKAKREYYKIIYEKTECGYVVKYSDTTEERNDLLL